MWAGLLDERIADVRQREAEERRGWERRPSPAQWIVQHGIGLGPPMIHTTLGEGAAQCWARVGADRCAPTTREQARAALGENSAEACQICRPDTVLGLLG
ncbi:DUF6233 domain-containing protein [Streptomyces sp. NPDC058301]|uniref:DUF6233 domain-containing protein n=1 Tax=Streptomyces sp. NPDC058301 TaxID=3346436 RepID=UPI0036EDE56E